MALFIKFEGIDGECKDDRHKGWSDLLSFSWGLHKAAGATGQTRRRGVATVQDVVCTKEYDKVSPKLAESVLGGKVFSKVTIDDTTTYGDGNRVTFLSYELKNVTVTSHNVSAAGKGDAVPTESLSLNFEEIRQTYTEYDAKGSRKGNVEMQWKVEEGAT